MNVIAKVKVLAKRLPEKQLEDLINALEDERKRRGLIRDDELNNTKGLKHI